ncbi:hypothetical protein SUGI_0843350 [Cryptomeria japonica]|nr:hypothetical protein SUGI_0843350 [Cryptomeria japonica]
MQACIANALRATMSGRSHVRSLPRCQITKHSFHVRSGNAAHEDYEQSVPSLRAELRRLYKLVHPDLFNSHPHAQVTSFKQTYGFLLLLAGYDIYCGVDDNHD